MAATRLQETSTHITGINGKIQSGTTLPTDSNSGPAGVKTGQEFYHTGQNALHISTTTSTWRKIGLTTTSTTTS